MGPGKTASIFALHLHLHALDLLPFDKALRSLDVCELIGLRRLVEFRLFIRDERLSLVGDDLIIRRRTRQERRGKTRRWK